MNDIVFSFGNFSCQMEAIEVEDLRLPSINFDLKIELDMHGDAVTFTASRWFETVEIDRFLDAFPIGSESIATMTSMDRQFGIRLTSSSFDIFFKKTGPAKDSVDVMYSIPAGNEEIGIIRSAFKEFPKWW